MEYRHDLLNDKWVIEDVYHGMTGGFFLEAGAVNGVNGSATFVLEHDYAWSGICVEPIEKHYQALFRRRKCRADNRALYSESGLFLEFQRLNERSGLSGLTAHLRKSTRELAKSPGMAERILKETVSLFDLLKQHKAPEIIHYFCLDVEGAELKILEPFPFDCPYKILALSIEGNSCDALMRQNHYRPVRNSHTEKLFEHYYIHRNIDQYIG